MHRSMRDSSLLPGQWVHVPATFTDPHTSETIDSTVTAKVVMARLPGKTLLDFGDFVATVDNELILEVRVCDSPRTAG